MKKLLLALCVTALFSGCSIENRQVHVVEEQQKIKLSNEESKILGFSECDDIDTLYYFVSGETDFVIMNKAVTLFNDYLQDKIRYSKIEKYIESVSHKLERPFREPVGNDVTYAKRYYNGSDYKTLLFDKETNKFMFDISMYEKLVDKCNAKFIEKEDY